MLIKYIKAKNYKTYKSLDLNLEVEDGRSIILIGGENNGGKTTLFEAIYGALYGLKIDTPREFEALVNASYGKNDEWKNQEIVLEIQFTGDVLSQQKQYKMVRTYRLVNDKIVWNIRLDFDATTYSYGTHTPASESRMQKECVDRIIKANLPPELSSYFLFDALQTGNLVKESQINTLIKENIRSVMGFNKYLVLKQGALKLLDEVRASRLDNEQQRNEYNDLLQRQEDIKKDLEKLQQQKSVALAYSTEKKQQYEQLLRGEKSDATIREKIAKTKEKLDSIVTEQKNYSTRAKDFAQKVDTMVFLPRLASLIADEVQVILDSKLILDEKKRGLLTDAQIDALTKQIVEIINNEYQGTGVINAEFVAGKVKEAQASKLTLTDQYAYLGDEDVEALRQMLTAQYVNGFALLDRERVALNQRVGDMPGLRDNIEDYRAQLTGDDYSVIKKYEDNEEELKKCKQDIADLERELGKIQTHLSSFDIRDESEDDPKFNLLKKLPELFDKMSERLLEARRNRIEQRMKELLNQVVLAYKDVIQRVELSIVDGEITFRLWHINGNEIILDQLNAASKQLLMQVLLKVLRDEGDYDPPVMIDTVMGNFDKKSRQAVLEHYFPNLAAQTILLSNDIEITPTEDSYGKLRPYIAKAYLLRRDKVAQCTTVEHGYFNGYK